MLKSKKSGVALTNKIRRLRFDNDEMTQQQLADKVGLTRQTIAAIEACKYSPSLEVAFQIADVFGLVLTDIFEWKISMPS
jgi:putative transcriptional regulator